MREFLEIRPDGQLVESRFDEETGQSVIRDVTSIAPSLLFERCQIADGVLLGDIFLIVKKNLEIFDSILGNWCKNFVEEGLIHAASGGETLKDIEYLELYWFFEKSREWQEYPDGPRPTKYSFKKQLGREETDSGDFTGDYELTGYHHPDFHGIGYLLTEDKIECGNTIGEKGSRINYGISFTPANELAFLPIRLNTTIVLHNGTEWKEEPQKFINCDYTLGDILYGIFWELGFYGGPKKRDEQSQQLKDITKEIDKEFNK